MNDDDYAVALLEELDMLNKEVEETRAERHKGRKLIEHLKDEQASLMLQKEQRVRRNALLTELEMLQDLIDQKKEIQMQVLEELAVSKQEYERLLLVGGRWPSKRSVKPEKKKARPADLHDSQGQLSVQSTSPSVKRQYVSRGVARQPSGSPRKPRRFMRKRTTSRSSSNGFDSSSSSLVFASDEEAKGHASLQELGHASIGEGKFQPTFKAHRRSRRAERKAALETLSSSIGSLTIFTDEEEEVAKSEDDDIRSTDHDIFAAMDAFDASRQLLHFSDDE